MYPEVDECEIEVIELNENLCQPVSATAKAGRPREKRYKSVIEGGKRKKRKHVCKNCMGPLHNGLPCPPMVPRVQPQQSTVAVRPST